MLGVNRHMLDAVVLLTLAAFLGVSQKQPVASGFMSQPLQLRPGSEMTKQFSQE